MARMTIRVEFENGRALGPGKVRLLELVEQEGSIRRAALAMEMSYRRAWLLIHELEAMMSTPVVVAASGGSGGGGTNLTQAGRDLVDRYRALEISAAHSVEDELSALSKMTNSTARARSQRPRPTRAIPRRQRRV